MVRRSLVVVALLALAAPAAAQEEMIWTPKRPDAQAPFGVWGGRTLEQGEVEFTYRYNRLNMAGIRFDDSELSPDFTAELYKVVPLSLVTQTHSFGVAVATSRDLTLSANIGYGLHRREQITADGQFYYVTEANQIGDLTLEGLFRVYDEGLYRAHVHVGALIPTGSTEATAATPFSTPGEEALPYDMRGGAGVFGIMPGLTLLAQNETGTVGTQLKGTMFVGNNDRDFSPGDRMEFNFWASYRANAYFSVSARAAYFRWGAYEGADPALELDRDPGNDGRWLSGSRLDLPLGINLFLPEGSRFEGHRLSLEYVFPTTHSYDGPQLGADWGLVAGWQVVF